MQNVENLCGVQVFCRNGRFSSEFDNTATASHVRRKVATGFATRKGCLSRQTVEELDCGTGEDSKHEMAHYFGCTANTNKHGAEVIFDLGVDSFHRRALLESSSRGRFEGDFFSTPWVWVDDRNMAELSGKSSDFLCVVGGIHQIVTDSQETLITHLSQWDGNLGIVDGGRSKNGTDGDIAVDDVQVEFVTDPRFFKTLGIFLGAAVTVNGQVEEVFCQGTLQLQLQTFGWGGFDDLSFARTSPFFGASWNGIRFGDRFFTSRNGSGITADVTDNHMAQVIFDHGFMNFLGQVKFSEVSKRTGEGGFGRNLGQSFPTDETAQARTILEIVNEGSVGSEIPNGFCNESLGDREAVFGFASDERPPKGSHKTFDIGEFDDRNEALAFIRKNADFIFQHGEELALDDKSSGGKAHKKLSNWLLTIRGL